MNYLYLVFALLFAALAAGSKVAKRRLERKFPLTKNRAEIAKIYTTDSALQLLRDPNLPDLYDPKFANEAGVVAYIYQVVELHFKLEVIGFVLASVVAFIDFFGL